MFIWIAVIAGSVFLDQITKYLTILYLKPVDTVPIIRDVLHLTYVENTGAAFGMMKDQRWLFMTISTVAIIAVLVYMFVQKPQSRLECVALSFIVGGGIGNMIDRTLLGYVVDMIDFRLINFAVFNVADSFVCVGVGLMMLYLILSVIDEQKPLKTIRIAPSADAADVDDMVEISAETDPVEPIESLEIADIAEDGEAPDEESCDA